MTHPVARSGQTCAAAATECAYGSDIQRHSGGAIAHIKDEGNAGKALENSIQIPGWITIGWPKAGRLPWRMIDRKERHFSAQGPHSAVVVKATTTTSIFSMQGKVRHGSFGDQPHSAVPSRHTCR